MILDVHFHSVSLCKLLDIEVILGSLHLIYKLLKHFQAFVWSIPLEVPQDYLLIEVSHCMLHRGKSLESHAYVSSGLNEEDFLGFRTELEHHCCMIILRSTVGSDEFASCRVASEEEDVERVSYLDKLFLRDLLVFPEVFGLGRCILPLITFRFLDVN